MAIIPWRPMSLSTWPNIWDDDDMLSMTSGTNDLDVYETDDEIVVKANVAGVPADKVENGVITVTFKKAEASKPKQLKVKSK